MAIKKKNSNISLRDQIIGAIQSKKKYKLRSAPGLSDQTGIPLEHMEQYLLDLAEKGVLSIGVDADEVYWVQEVERS